MPNKVEIDITADDLTGGAFASVMAKFAALKAAAKEAGSVSIVPNADSGTMTSSLMFLKQKMQSLGIADIADINQSPGRITSQLMLLKRLIQQAKISDLLDINANESQLAAQLAALRTLAGAGVEVPVNFSLNKASAAAALAPLTFLGQGQVPWISAAMAGAAMKATGGGSGVSGVTVLTAAMAAAAAQAAATGAAVNRLVGSGSGGSGGGGGWGLLGLAGAAGAANNAWILLTKKFGGATGGWTGTFAGIGLWHIALDGFIEGAIIAVSSMAALAAAADALGGTAINLYSHLEAVYQVNSALGGHIPPLRDRFVALQKALAPQGIEIYGAALNAINQESGSLGKAMGPVVGLFTEFAAKFDLWLKGFGSTGGIFRAGIGFLSQLGGFLSSIGVGIGNLIKDDPGIARFLLDVFQGAGKVFVAITKLPGPLVEFALALHGAYVWGSVLAGLGVRLIQFFQGMGKSLIMLAANPYVDLAILAATFAYLAYEANQADSATKSFIASQNYQLSGLSGWQAFAQSISDVGVDLHKINTTTGASVMKSMGTWQQTLTLGGYALNQLGLGIQNFAQLWSGRKIVTGLDDFGHAISDVFGFSNAAFGAKAQSDINAYFAQIRKLEGGQVGMLATIGSLQGKGYSLAQSWALLSLAGVKLGDSVAVANQKVLNLLAGYNKLSIQGGILANSINAITFQSLQQQSQITAITGAWSNFFTLISGGENALLTFNQDLNTMGVHAAKLGGLSAKQVTSGQNFMQAAAGAQALLSNLTLMASAAGLGTAGTNDLTQATKDMLQTMLPAARNSGTLTATLFTLAQQGGYGGADSFKALAAWVGHTASPLRNLNDITKLLTISSAGLTHDIRALSDALGTTLNSAMSTAIFAASGGQKYFDQFAYAVDHANGNVGQMVKPSSNLAYELIQVTGSVSGAKGEFYTFGKALGLPISQLNTLWADALRAQGAIDALHGKTVDVNIVTNDTTYRQNFNLNPKKRASGGMASGWTIVGETGWELLNLPAGSQVYSHSQSKAMAGGWGGGGGAVAVKLSVDKSGASDLERALINWFMKFVRINGGGSVQSAWEDDLLG